MSAGPRAARLRRTQPAGQQQLPPIAIGSSVETELLASRRSRAGLHSDAFVEQWISRQRSSGTAQVRIVPLDALRDWSWEEGTGNLVHQTGRFFIVLGLDVRQRAGLHELSWNQPIIDQAEVGILGIMAKSIRGVLHFCLQAKEEPGNIGGVQLSPTVQATFSNYTGAHQGSRPPFLALFDPPSPEAVIFSRLQTEDGSRFLYKSNRNMIVLAGEEIPVALPDHFIWLTLNQIATLMRRDNLVNACTRSVLSGLALPWSTDTRSATKPPLKKRGDEPASIRDTLQWLDDMRASHHLRVKRIGLGELSEWERDAKGFYSHRSGLFFRVVGLSVRTETREVRSWDQPIIENVNRGVIGLLLRERSGVRECLVQARPEAGNRPSVQIAPTVQFTAGNYLGNRKLPVPFLFEEFSEPGRFPLHSDTHQAEEGARFFRECHAHRVLLLPPGEKLDAPPGFRWVPESHLRFLLHLGEQVNSCARSIIACLL